MAKIDERYKRGKIYTVRCRYDDILLYVGSTIQPLAKRMTKHRSDKKCSLYKFVDGDWDNFYIELYEEYPCDNKEQLLKREGEVIRDIATINKCIAGRDMKQYYQDNHDKLIEYHKQYRQDNRDEILEKKKQYYQDNLDKIKEKKKEYQETNRDKILEKAKEYHQNNRDEILERMKKYRQNNRDKLLEKGKEKYQNNRDEILKKQKEKCKCDICGAEITKNHLKRHQKSAKCMSANK